MLTSTEGIILILLFAALMIGVSFLSRKKDADITDFLVMGRSLSTARGALSIAVSWIWAPAIFIVSAQAFNNGLAGVFWFTLPNILCFMVFAFIAVRVRQQCPDGTTLPEFISNRFGGSKNAHLAAITVTFGYQLGAVIINAVAGGLLLNLLTGIDFQLAVIIMSATAVSYSMLSGLRASVNTDVIQMLLILLIAFILIPWLLVEVGGWGVVQAGLGGKTGEFDTIFNPAIAYSFGIATTIGLLSGPVADQMFFQRSFAVDKNSIKKVFIGGGLIFGLVPITLSILGFIAASPEVLSTIDVKDAQMVGPVVIEAYLPRWTLMLFAVMAFAGLTSTLDSAYCAIGSIGTIDIFKKYKANSENTSHKTMLSFARKTMLIVAFVGTLIALLKPQLLWVFLIYGALASSIFFPIVFSVFNSNLSANGFFTAIIISLLLGTPLSIYANVTNNVDLIVLAAIMSVLIGLIVCGYDVMKNTKTANS